MRPGKSSKNRNIYWLSCTSTKYNVLFISLNLKQFFDFLRNFNIVNYLFQHSILQYLIEKFYGSKI